MTDTYSIEKKKKIAEKIHSLSSKDQFRKVKDIIITNNPEIEFTKNGNGLFAQFQSLNPETYVELEKFLNKLDKKKLKNAENELDDDTDALTSELQTLTDESSHKKQDYSKKLRLTNTETHLLNRVKYEKELKKNENSDNEEDVYYNPDEQISNASEKSPSEKPKTESIFFKKSHKQGNK